MSTENAPTINQLMDLFLLSRSRGEWVKLSMETKDGQDSLNFSLGNPADAQAGQPRTWTPGSTTPPWTWPPPPPTWTRPKRRKSPSQWRRDQRRRQDFLAKKVSANNVVNGSNAGEKVIAVDPIDEIDLSEIPKKDNIKEVPVNELVKIDGIYKNPSFKPWTVIEPEKESKVLWNIIEKDNVVKGIEEIGDGSTCFEHYFEFWGTWRVKQDGISEDFFYHPLHIWVDVLGPYTVQHLVNHQLYHSLVACVRK